MNKLYGVIGSPIAHSMSPLMHNDAFFHLKMNGYYHAFDVPEEKLQEAVQAFRLLKVAGFNVTIPHKVKIMEFLDEVDPEAQMIGAVNTVVNHEGRLIGYNTDGRGYLHSLLAVVTKPLTDSLILVIGAGGAARGVVAAIANDGAKEIMITNRTLQKAEIIKSNCHRLKSNINVCTLEEARQEIERYDIIINTTSIGMSPNTEEIPIEINNIKAGVILSDLIYNPLKTKWLTLGEQKGAIIHNGVGMFVNQGALAFEKWTRIKPDTERMKEIVLKQLGGK